MSETVELGSGRVLPASHESPDANRSPIATRQPPGGVRADLTGRASALTIRGWPASVPPGCPGGEVYGPRRDPTPGLSHDRLVEGIRRCPLLQGVPRHV